MYNHNKAQQTKTVCIFLGIYCISMVHVECVSCMLIAQCATCCLRLKFCGVHNFVFKLLVTAVISMAKYKAAVTPVH